MKSFQFLLKSGAKIELLSSGGYTPLFIAYVERHVDVVKLLIKEGADNNKKLFELSPFPFPVDNPSLLSAMLREGKDRINLFNSDFSVVSFLEQIVFTDAYRSLLFFVTSQDYADDFDVPRLQNLLLIAFRNRSIHCIRVLMQFALERELNLIDFYNHVDNVKFLEECLASGDMELIKVLIPRLQKKFLFQGKTLLEYGYQYRNLEMLEYALSKKTYKKEKKEEKKK